MQTHENRSCEGWCRRKGWTWQTKEAPKFIISSSDWVKELILYAYEVYVVGGGTHVPGLRYETGNMVRKNANDFNVLTAGVCHYCAHVAVEGN